jgi:hypothetical protein
MMDRYLPGIVALITADLAPVDAVRLVEDDTAGPHDDEDGEDDEDGGGGGDEDGGSDDDGGNDNDGRSA